MRRSFVFFFLISLLATGQEESELPSIPPPPDVPEGPDPVVSILPEEDPLAGILGTGESQPFATLPTGIEIYSDAIDLDALMTNNRSITDAIVKYRGNIRLEANNGLEVYADRASANLTKKTVLLTGHVSIYQDGLVYRGNSTTVNLETKQFETTNLRMGFSPLLVEAESIRKITSDGRDAYIADNAGITTHDVENPDFWLRAKRATIFPGDKIIFTDFTLQTGKRNLLWLPYLAQPLDTNLGYLVIPGAQTNLGVFMKNRYGIMLGGKRDRETGENKDAWLLSQWHTDLYSNKGLGLGIDLFDTRLDSRDQYGWLKLYSIHDLNPEDQRAGIDRGNLNPNRFRLEFNHRIPIAETPNAEYTFDANLNWLSDEYYLEDFDPTMYRLNRAPDNYVGFARRSANSLTMLGARLRLNNFYQSDTRLPEFTHDWIRQPFLDSPVLYESQTAFGIYEERLAERQRNSLQSQADLLLPGDPRRNEIGRLLDDRGFARLHTYHEFSLPIKTGHFNIVPRIGAGHTNYQAVLGPDDSTSRTHFSATIDFSTKLTKAYPGLSSQKWGLDGARHIIEPYTSLTWLSTDELDSSFGRIDRLTATSRPRPRQVGRFTAVDDLQNWSILRMGVRNRLVTQRDGGTQDWLMLDTYFDTFFEDPEFSRDFSNIYNDLRWSPAPWFELDLETQFPLLNEANFTEVAASMRLMPTSDFEFNFEYRHLKNHPILRDSDRIVLESFARLNDYWGIGTHHRFEAVDSTLELQQYNVHYDFDSFVGSLGFFIRNNSEQDEYGLMLSFGIKEIPSLSLPIEIGAQ
ncbi:MAG: LPS-assembly protein [Akkermansiaceae bacterium]|jgi:LPS-assembly protein